MRLQASWTHHFGSSKPDSPPPAPARPGFATLPEGLEAARAALAAKGLPAAQAIWAQLRRDFPGDAGAYAEETQALMRERLFADAEALQIEAQQVFPDAAGFWNDHAWAALFRGDQAAAADRWQAMRARFPDNADGYVHGAKVLQTLGRAEEAEAVMAAGLLRFPDLVPAQLDQASAALQRDDVAEALRRWERVVKAAPDNPECYVLGSRILWEAGKINGMAMRRDGWLAPALRRWLARPLIGETIMDSTDLLAGLDIASLPPPVRQALAGLAAPGARLGAYYNAINALCAANQAASARLLLEAVDTKRGGADELRFQLARARVEAAGDGMARALALLEELKRDYSDNFHPFRLQAEILARMGDYATALDVLRAAPPSDSPQATTDLTFRAMRLSIYLAARDSRPVFVDPAAAPPLDQVVAVMMIRDEEDLIGRNLRHHYRMGMRKFVILLNCCGDRTAAIIEQFQRDHTDAMICTVVDPALGYYQASKTQAAVDFAGAYFAGVRRPATWCFVLDADEFISIDGGIGLGGLLARAEQEDKDFITFHLSNAVPGVCRDLGEGDSIYDFFDTIVRCAVPVVTKNAFRLSLNAQIAMGNHSLAYPGMRMDRGFAAATLGARFIHLPYRSQSQLKTKIINGVTAFEATDLDKGLGGHWRRQYKDYQEQGEPMLGRQLQKFHEKTVGEAARLPPFTF